MPRLYIHPETNLFALREALADAGSRLCVVSDGHTGYLCLPDELPHGCTVIHVAPRPILLQTVDQRLEDLARLSLNDTVAAALLAEVRQ